MTLIDRLNEALKPYDLVFISKKETNTKFKGYLIDKTKGDIEIPYDLEKSLQAEFIEKHCEWLNNYVMLYEKVKGW